MRRFLILGLCAAAAGCAAGASNTNPSSIYPPGGPVAADFNLCDLKPAPSACSVPYAELTAATARKRLDAEYARLLEADPAAAREFAVTSFSSFSVPGILSSPHYLALRDRAWKAAFAAPEETGDRYFKLTSIGDAAFEAGDRATAPATIEHRRELIRRRPEDRPWERKLGVVFRSWHLTFDTSRDEAWSGTARDAARYGQVNLALELVNEAFPPSEGARYKYDLQSAAVRLEAHQYEQAETAAQWAVRTAPLSSEEGTPFHKDPRAEAYRYLIESRIRQGKETDNSVQELYRYVTEFSEDLFRHASNFLSLAEHLAPFAPKAARRFLTAGQQIARINGVGWSLTETMVCKALEDKVCLLNSARSLEEVIRADDPHITIIGPFRMAAWVYAMAGDFRSVKRLLQKAEPGGCNLSVYAAINDGLKKEGDFNTISAWLREWTLCQLGEEPNFDSGYFGGNDWQRGASAYAEYSRWQFEAGQHEAALHSARMALLLALETQNTWNVDNEGFRAEDFARAYGSALGALVRAEAAAGAGR